MDEDQIELSNSGWLALTLQMRNLEDTHQAFISLTMHWASNQIHPKNSEPYFLRCKYNMSLNIHESQIKQSKTLCSLLQGILSPKNAKTLVSAPILTREACDQARYDEAELPWLHCLPDHVCLSLYAAPESSLEILPKFEEKGQLEILAWRAHMQPPEAPFWAHPVSVAYIRRIISKYINSVCSRLFV